MLNALRPPQFGQTAARRMPARGDSKLLMARANASPASVQGQGRAKPGEANP